MFPDCSLVQLGQTCLETTDLRLHQLQSHSAGNQWDKGEGRGRCGVRRKHVGSLINHSTSSESCIEFSFLLKNKKKHFINPVKPRGLIGIFLLIDFFFSSKAPSRPSEPHLPLCQPESKSKPSQVKSKGKVKSKEKSKSRRKNAQTSKSAAKPAATMPPFDFESYMRDKDNRNFKLLIDQPEKCRIREEGGEGGEESITAPYMLIAVKSTAADFDKRQVNPSVRPGFHCC